MFINFEKFLYCDAYFAWSSRVMITPKMMNFEKLVSYNFEVNVRCKALEILLRHSSHITFNSKTCRSWKKLLLLSYLFTLKNLIIQKKNMQNSFSYGTCLWIIIILVVCSKCYNQKKLLMLTKIRIYLSDKIFLRNFLNNFDVCEENRAIILFIYLFLTTSRSPWLQMEESESLSVGIFYPENFFSSSPQVG